MYYDRVLVMNEGQVAEFDTPLVLYDAGGGHCASSGVPFAECIAGIFHSMCEQASLSREDIIRIRSAAGVHS